MSSFVGTTSTPRSQAVGEKQLASLLRGLADHNPGELTHDVVAKHVLKAHTVKADASKADSNTENKKDDTEVIKHVKAVFYHDVNSKDDKGCIVRIVKENFEANLRDAYSIFSGTAKDDWAPSEGAITIKTRPDEVYFEAHDGLRIHEGDEPRLLITFYDILDITSVAAVYVGKAIGQESAHTSGRGKFASSSSSKA
ncbi:hypothetical protein BC628DRAFT_689525 [Trametes gibbosa]|nr:hypothetical protein BC628DRAFT_689525 [Trametes gibbosa]